MQAHIRKFSHHFNVTPYNDLVRKIIVAYSRQFLYVSPLYNKKGEIVAQSTKMYAASNEARTVFRFHANVYEEFVSYLKEHYIPIEQMEVEIVPDFVFDKVNYLLSPNYTPRDTQVPVIDFITNPDEKIFKLLALDTGEGKTISTFFAMAQMKIKTIIILRPGYIERWNDEIRKVCINTKTISVIGPDLKKFITGCKNGTLEYDIALISNRTYANFIKAYKAFDDEILEMGYDCTPDNFFETCRAGFRVIDEVHQDFHFNFRLDLYSHVPYALSLSATLINQGTFMERMYEIAYPSKYRYHTKIVKKFRHLITFFYQIDPKWQIRDSNRGLSAYSQNVYETSIIKFKKVLKDYLNMINEVIKQTYLIHREPGDKLIVFAGSIQMCTEITDYLTEKYPGLSVARYTGEDDYSNLIDPDIRVSTVGSAGTAHDIPRLITVIMTVALDSIQGNLQVFGRLREIKGKEVQYITMVNGGHRKQMRYHENRHKSLSRKALSARNVSYPYILG